MTTKNVCLALTLAASLTGPLCAPSALSQRKPAVITRFSLSQRRRMYYALNTPPPIPKPPRPTVQKNDNAVPSEPPDPPESSPIPTPVPSTNRPVPQIAPPARPVKVVTLLHYRQQVARRYGLTAREMESILREGRAKGWPAPRAG